jgi:hypothetical protein
MTEAEVCAYYDIPENEQSMCDLLTRTHPGWTVRRLRPERTFRSVPVWSARRASWPASHPPLINENAGLLNVAMTMVDKGAVAS